MKPNPGQKDGKTRNLDTDAMARTQKEKDNRLSGSQILLEGTLELLLLGRGLESTVSELGRSVDPLEADLLESLSGGVGEHGLAQSHDTLLGTGNRALDHDEVVVDLTVADEATQTRLRMLVLL
jgi:hypothetical protein